MATPNESTEPTTKAKEPTLWFTRYAKALIALIITIAVVGAYFAFSIPLAVFPTTNFSTSAACHR
jgi:hypothetical protein